MFKKNKRNMQDTQNKQNKQNKRKQGQGSYINSEALTNGMQELLEGRVVYFTEEELGNKETADKWNEFMHHLTEERRYHINYANNLL